MPRDSTKASTTRTRKPKDPNAPKRPTSAYFFFMQENRERVKAENPNISFGQIGKKMGEMWANLSATEKKPYDAKAKEDKERYEKEKAAYEARKGETA